MTAADHSRRTILLLAIAQAFYNSCIIILFSTAGIVGLKIAPTPGLATLPVTTFVIGAAVSTIPASLLMQRVGRKPVFFFGACASMLSSLLAVWSIFHGNFQAFCFATALAGVFQATSGFYRFAAAESASEGTRSIAISWVLTGGVVAAIVGTLISSSTAEYFPDHLFAGSYAAAALLALANFGVVTFLRLPKPSAEEIASPQRSWRELLQQKRLVVAMAAAMISYALMNLMMTAAPVAMIGCGFTQKDASWVIQWHVLAMFVPSFFTGQLIRIFGVEKITAIGMLLLISSAVAGLMGITFSHFAIALILLGLGWNFGFIGGTTMLTSSYWPSERGKVQAANDFGIAALMAVASLSSGRLLADFGWNAVPIAIFPASAIVLVMIAWLAMKSPRAA